MFGLHWRKVALFLSLWTIKFAFTFLIQVRQRLIYEIILCRYTRYITLLPRDILFLFALTKYKNSLFAYRTCKLPLCILYIYLTEKCVPKYKTDTLIGYCRTKRVFILTKQRSYKMHIRWKLASKLHFPFNNFVSW